MTMSNPTTSCPGSCVRSSYSTLDTVSGGGQFSCTMLETAMVTVCIRIPGIYVVPPDSDNASRLPVLLVSRVASAVLQASPTCSDPRGVQGLSLHSVYGLGVGYILYLLPNVT